MGDVVQMGGRRYFTLEQARDLLPVLRRITAEATREVELLQAQATAADEDSEAGMVARNRIEEAYGTWARKVAQLGGQPKGPWLVDFDNGEDLYCWRWPETEILWAHSYEGGYAGRYPVQEEQ